MNIHCVGGRVGGEFKKYLAIAHKHVKWMEESSIEDITMESNLNKLALGGAHHINSFLFFGEISLSMMESK